MTIRPMTLDELQMVLGWAAQEGWNPGLDDASAFHAADPEGFLLKLVDGEPVAAVSVVNHSAQHGFLGLYLCKPEFRGQGHGIAVWRSGRAHAGDRCVGLDGVPAQQDNYRRDGFHWAGRTTRFMGPAPSADANAVRLATPEDLPHLLALDLLATGYERPRFITAWLTPTQTRKTVIIEREGAVTAMATFRRCLEGTKLGPFYATDREDMGQLLAARPDGCGTGPLIVDVPDTAPAFQTALRDAGFAPSFETARMYTGTAPDGSPPPYFGVASLELG